MLIKCKHCGYAWDCYSKAKRVSCSKCKTSIMIPSGHAQADTQQRRTYAIPIETSVIQALRNDKQLTEVKFPPSLWKDARLAQRFMALDNMGEKYVILKVNDEGILSL